MGNLVAQDFDKTISATADSLAKKIINSNRKTVAFTDFINIDESTTQLGVFLSEEILTELSNLTENQSKFRVLERSKIDRIFNEKNLILQTDGSKMAKELGKLDVADILIFATITDFNGYYRVVIKLLDTKTGDALSATKVNFVKTPSLEELNNIKLNKPTPPVEQPNATPNNTPPAKVENKSEVGDYCFKNVLTNNYYSVEVKIINKGGSTPVKTINVTSDQTSCVYELPIGVYKIDILWTLYGSEVKRETKEIKVKSGEPNTIELICK